MRSANDAQVQNVVTQVKSAMALGPRNPTKQVTTLEPPVTMAATAGKKKTTKSAGTAAARA